MVKVREATLKDVDQICYVLVDFYNMEDNAEAKKAFISEMEKDFHYIVATQNDKIIGLVTWLPHGLPKHGLFELDRICILSDARGKGVGRILVDELIVSANKWYAGLGHRMRKLYILTHESNVNAHKFYEKINFIHETTLSDHYYKGQDERVYVKFFEDKDF